MLFLVLFFSNQERIIIKNLQEPNAIVHTPCDTKFWPLIPILTFLPFDFCPSVVLKNPGHTDTLLESLQNRFVEYNPSIVSTSWPWDKRLFIASPWKKSNGLNVIHALITTLSTSTFFLNAKQCIVFPFPKMVRIIALNGSGIGRQNLPSGSKSWKYSAFLPSWHQATQSFPVSRNTTAMISICRGVWWAHEVFQSTIHPVFPGFHKTLSSPRDDEGNELATGTL